MKKLILLFVLSTASYALHAQIQIGVTTAVNSTFVLDEGLSKDPRYNSTMTYQFAPIGLSFQANLGKTIGLQLESILANQGQIYEVLNAANEVVGQRNIDLSYIQIPLLLKFMNGSNKGTRANFSFGPQLSILSEGIETLQYDQSVMDIPDEFAMLNDDGTTYTIIDPTTSKVLTEEAVMTDQGLYEVPELNETELLSNQAANEYEKFRNTEFQLAASFGLDIDLSKHLSLSSVIRANYSLTDMRNGDVIDMIQQDGFNSILDKRSNLAVGVQLGLNYVFGVTRSFKMK